MNEVFLSLYACLLAIMLLAVPLAILLEIARGVKNVVVRVRSIMPEASTSKTLSCSLFWEALVGRKIMTRLAWSPLAFEAALETIAEDHQEEEEALFFELVLIYAILAMLIALPFGILHEIARGVKNLHFLTTMLLAADANKLRFRPTLALVVEQEVEDHSYCSYTEECSEEDFEEIALKDIAVKSFDEAGREEPIVRVRSIMPEASTSKTLSCSLFWEALVGRKILTRLAWSPLAFEAALETIAEDHQEEEEDLFFELVLIYAILAMLIALPFGILLEIARGVKNLHCHMLAADANKLRFRPTLALLVEQEVEEHGYCSYTEECSEEDFEEIVLKDIAVKSFDESDREEEPIVCTQECPTRKLRRSARLKELKMKAEVPLLGTIFLQNGLRRSARLAHM